MAAINNTAAILANSAGQYQNANARIFDAITQAADAYEARQRAKEAALEAERKRQAEIKTAEQAIALDPEKAIMREAMARGVDPNSVTPEMRAAAAAGKDFLGSKVLADQFGRPYKPYNFGAADMMAPVVQVENLPPASATADMMAPLPAPTFTSPSGGLLPPPATKAEMGGSNTKPDTSLLSAPSPVGEPEVKRSAIASVKLPKMVQGAGNFMVPDPVDQKRYEAELAVATEADKGGAKTEAEKRAAKFNTSKSFNSLISDYSNIASKVNRAIGQSNRFNTGALAGGVQTEAGVKATGRGVLGSGFLTGGVNLNETLKTIEADSAFSALQNMRDNSPTGGALGGIAVRELELLGAAKQSLSQSQDEAQLDTNLKQYKRIRADAVRNVAEAYNQQYGVYPEGYDPKQFIDTGSIPQGAIDKLKSDPKLRDAFDAKYGAGAANKALGR